jgi:excisionase family DNA binding protein
MSIMSFTAPAPHPDVGRPDPKKRRPGPPGPTGQALYRIPEAMRLLGLSRSVIYKLIRSGRLRSVKEGSSRLIPAEAIAEYVALLEAEAESDR